MKKSTGKDSEDSDMKINKTSVTVQQYSELVSTSKKFASDTDVWGKPVTVAVEKTREQEFDDYFEDMFL